MPQHQPVIDQVLPRIAQMQPLAKEAVETRDFEMCKRIALIFLQLGNDYIIPVMDESNQLKDSLLEVRAAAPLTRRRSSSSTPTPPPRSPCSASTSGTSSSPSSPRRSPVLPCTTFSSASSTHRFPISPSPTYVAPSAAHAVGLCAPQRGGRQRAAPQPPRRGRRRAGATPRVGAHLQLSAAAERRAALLLLQLAV